MYQAGDTVEYKTSKITFLNGEIASQTKVGVVEEAFSTADNHPCYWIEGEKELILHSQVLRKVCFVDKNNRVVKENDTLKFDNGHLYMLVKSDDKLCLKCLSRPLPLLKAEMFADNGCFISAERIQKGES